MKERSLTPEITPNHFDRIASAKPEKLWGAPAIAAALGISVDTVREWARDPSVPIYRPRGYFARRTELEAWLRTKPGGCKS